MSGNGMVFESVEARLCRVAAEAPGSVAIIFGTDVITYADLVARVHRAARHLRRLGVARGVRFAAYAQNCPELLVCYFAAARLGAVFVPLNPNLTASEVAYAYGHSEARLLLHDEDVAGPARMAVPDATRHAITQIGGPDDGTDEDASAVVSPADDLLIIYTSGSTGVPKAIVLDHASQAQVVESLAAMWGITTADTTLVALPLGYLYGLTTASVVSLLTRGKLVVQRRFHPREVLEALVGHSATVFHGVPTMFSMMLDYCDQHDVSFDLSGMRALICAGAPLSDETRQRFAARFRKPLQNYYAMSEASPVFGAFASDPRPLPEGSVGRAAPGLTVRIVRPDGSDCGDGEQGEILVRAAATMSRYLNAPDMTASVIQDGLFRSGDLGYRTVEGDFFITGRIKDIIIRGGANIAPAEVEDVLARHPAVQDVAVVGAPDAVFGEVPVAFVALRHGMAASEHDLVAHAESVLSDFKVPRRILFVSDLPLGKTGKIDKAALKERLPQAGVAEIRMSGKERPR